MRCIDRYDGVGENDAAMLNVLLDARACVNVRSRTLNIKSGNPVVDALLRTYTFIDRANKEHRVARNIGFVPAYTIVALKESVFDERTFKKVLSRNPSCLQIRDAKYVVHGSLSAHAPRALALLNDRLIKQHIVLRGIIAHRLSDKDLADYLTSFISGIMTIQKQKNSSSKMCCVVL